MTVNKKRMCCCGTTPSGVRFIEIFPKTAIPSGVVEKSGTISFWIRLDQTITASDSTVIFKTTGTEANQTPTNATSDVTFADHENAVLVFGRTSWKEIRPSGQAGPAPLDSFKENKTLNHRGWTWDNDTSRTLTDAQMDALTGETRLIWRKPENTGNRPLDGSEDIGLVAGVGYLFVSSAYDAQPALSQTTTSADGTSYSWKYYPYLEATQPEHLAYWTSAAVPPTSDRVLVYDFADIFPSSISVTYRVRGTIRDLVTGNQDAIDQTFSKTYNKTTISAVGGIPSKSAYTFNFPDGDLNSPHGFQGSYSAGSPDRASSIQTVYRLAESSGADEESFTISAAFGTASVIIADIPVYAFRYFYQGYQQIGFQPVISPPGYDNVYNFGTGGIQIVGNENQFVDPSQRRSVGILQSDLNFFRTEGQPPPAGCFSIPPLGGQGGTGNAARQFARNYKGSEVGNKNIVTSLQFDNGNGSSIVTDYPTGDPGPVVDVPNPVITGNVATPELPSVSHVPAFAWGLTNSIQNPPAFSLAEMTGLTEETCLEAGVETPGIYCSTVRQLGQYSQTIAGTPINQAGLTSVISCGLLEVTAIS